MFWQEPSNMKHISKTTIYTWFLTWMKERDRYKYVVLPKNMVAVLLNTMGRSLVTQKL
jgi:hypothetical protein